LAEAGARAIEARRRRWYSYKGHCQANVLRSVREAFRLAKVRMPRAQRTESRFLTPRPPAPQKRAARDAEPVSVFYFLNGSDEEKNAPMTPDSERFGRRLQRWRKDLGMKFADGRGGLASGSVKVPRPGSKNEPHAEKAVASGGFREELGFARAGSPCSRKRSRSSMLVRGRRGGGIDVGVDDARAMRPGRAPPAGENRHVAELVLGAMVDAIAYDPSAVPTWPVTDAEQGYARRAELYGIGNVGQYPFKWTCGRKIHK
jgi:hypothetical protein